MSTMENEDMETGPEQQKRAAYVLKRFSEKYISQLNMSNIRATLDEEEERTDDLWLESCSFDIMLQLLYISYGKMLQRVTDNKADVSIFASVGNEKSRNEPVAGTVLAPETMAIMGDVCGRDEDKSDRMEKKRKFVPETSFLFDDDNDDEVFGNSEKKKKPTEEVKKGEWLKAGKSKKSTKDPDPFDDSPSLLKGRRNASAKVKVEEDDFVECVKPKSAEVPKRKSPRKAKASSSSAPAAASTSAALPKRVKVTNKFGIQMDEEWTISQKRRVRT